MKTALKGVTKIPESIVRKAGKQIANGRIRRVVIYARMSTNSKAQLHSLAAQVSELTRFIQRRSDWTLADTYLDFDSASGVKTRSEFNRMIDDAKSGMLDVIITKSVQRFGRNTEENLVAMRALVASGVVVYFQVEGISSEAPDAELQATLYSALAQADNASRREDRQWGAIRKAQDGTSGLYSRPCYGYSKNTDGVLVIEEEQAEVVREIFRLYLEGKSINGIKKTLEGCHIPSPTGKENWAVRTIDLILSNEKYYGTIVLFKTVMVGYPHSVKVDNRSGAYREKYCITNGIAAIIDEETYKAVQAEKQRRSIYEEDDSGKRRKSTRYQSPK